jgi:hypothetical protein
VNEHEVLLREIDRAKGPFLRQVNKGLVESLIQGNPEELYLSQVDNGEMKRHPECDSWWLMTTFDARDV